MPDRGEAMAAIAARSAETRAAAMSMANALAAACAVVCWRLSCSRPMSVLSMGSRNGGPDGPGKCYR